MLYGGTPLPDRGKLKARHEPITQECGEWSVYRARVLRKIKRTAVYHIGGDAEAGIVVNSPAGSQHGPAFPGGAVGQAGTGRQIRVSPLQDGVLVRKDIEREGVRGVWSHLQFRRRRELPTQPERSRQLRMNPPRVLREYRSLLQDAVPAFGAGNSRPKIGTGHHVLKSFGDDAQAVVRVVPRRTQSEIIRTQPNFVPSMAQHHGGRHLPLRLPLPGFRAGYDLPDSRDGKPEQIIASILAPQ